MVGTWGDVPLPEVEELKEFLEDLNPLQKIPEWILDLLDALHEVNDQAEFVTVKYRKHKFSTYLFGLKTEFNYLTIQANLSWIKYERAAYVPSNFIAVGDSVMQVNPTFGYVFHNIFILQLHHLIIHL